MNSKVVKIIVAVLLLAAAVAVYFVMSVMSGSNSKLPPDVQQLKQ